jgi:hypothetical protein
VGVRYREDLGGSKDGESWQTHLRAGVRYHFWARLKGAGCASVAHPLEAGGTVECRAGGSPDVSRDLQEHIIRVHRHRQKRTYTEKKLASKKALLGIAWIVGTGGVEAGGPLLVCELDCVIR